MTSYVLRVNERVMSGKSLLSYLKSLSKTNDYVEVLPPKVEYLTETVRLSDKELKEIEKSLKSGFCSDIESLKQKLDC